jgi:hypothetical protein
MADLTVRWQMCRTPSHSPGSPPGRASGAALARRCRRGTNAFTGTLGVASLVYGLSSAATSQNGVSHWGDTKVIASLAAAAVLLAAFAVIEVRSTHALLPIRVLRSRDRTGSYLISLCVGAALFGMFFFLTIFVQNVWATAR